MNRKRRLDKYSRKFIIPKKIIGWGIFIIILLSLFLFIGMGCGQKHGEEQIDRNESNMKPQIVDNDTSTIADVSVFVPSEKFDGSLTEKKVRIIDNRLKLNSQMEALIKILTANEYIPKNTHLIGNINIKDGVAEVNFSEEMKNFSGSAEEEAMVLKSIEKTLTYKNDKISSVKIKIMGKDAESLGGHIDLSEQQ